MSRLTTRQAVVLRGIATWIDERGTLPTFGDLQSAFNCKSKRTIAAHVYALRRKHMVRNTPEPGSIAITPFGRDFLATWQPPETPPAKL